EFEIFRQEHGLHATSFEHMCELIDSDATMSVQSQEFFNRYLDPKFIGTSGRAAAEKLLQLAEEKASSERSLTVPVIKPVESKEIIVQDQNTPIVPEADDRIVRES